MSDYNVIFEEKLSNALLSEKSKYDLKTIFYVLWDDKRIDMLQRFDEVVLWLQAIEEEFFQEQVALFENAIEDLENLPSWDNETKKEIQNLKNII